jgi:ubiquinone/menaquinone biosynthesis C-methylase UbiE
VYDRIARYYDAIYGFKDYAAEAAYVDGLIGRHKRSPGNALLDVACGTGKHLMHLRERYACEGLDLSARMLDVARARLPGIPFHQGDMVAFDLGRRFDAVVCLFSAIGYLTSPRRMRRAIRTMARHLKPGGILIVEPWFRPDDWLDGHVSARFVDRPHFKLARMGVSRRRGRLTPLDEHYLIATPEGIERFRHRHTLALHTDEEYADAFRAAGLKTFRDEGMPPEHRGLHVGVLA